MSTFAVPASHSSCLRSAPDEGPTDLENFSGWCRARIDAGVRPAVDPITGSGGLSLGAEQAGRTTIAAVAVDRGAEIPQNQGPDDHTDAVGIWLGIWRRRAPAGGLDDRPTYSLRAKRSLA